MTEKPRQTQVLDEYDRPVPGAEIYVTDTLTLGNAALTVDGTVPLSQPVVTDEFGIYTYWANEGFYREDIYYGGKLRYREMTAVGVPPQFKGDPGGNVMAIGLFVAGPSLTIPAGADLVRTSGYSTKGLGAADYIYDAAVDAAYVTANPRVSFVSSNGLGYRLDVSKGIDLQQVGGIPDTTALVGSAFNGTDNTAAYTAARKAIGNGGTLRLPQGAGGYRFASKLTHTEGINIEGDGWHENPGTVGAFTYVGIQRFPGSVLCFDQDAAGLEFIPTTDNNADSIVDEFQSSVYSSLSRIMLYGGGGTGTTAHGLFSRTIVFADQVRVTNFAGNGVHFLAWPAAALPYGNADLSVLKAVHVDHCGCHGWYMQGSDVNLLSLIGCSSTFNGGCGVLDLGELGNHYLGFHCSANNQSHPSNNGAAFSVAQRAFVLSEVTTPGFFTQSGWGGLSDNLAGSYVTASNVAVHTFTGCYTEPSSQGWKHCILAPSLISGGMLATADRVAPPVGSFPATTLNSRIFLNVDTFTSLAAGFNFNDTIVSDNATGAGGLTVKGTAATSDFNLQGVGGIATGLNIHTGGGTTIYNSPAHFFASASGVEMADMSTTAFNVPSGSVYKVNGTRVLGAAAAMSAGNATDLPTVISLANELLAKLRTQGVIL